MNALDTLAHVLAASLDSNDRPPCTYPDTGPLWLSEDSTERTQAAAHCDGCPIWDACLDAGESAGITGGRATFGVWAGWDYGRRGKRP